MVKLWWEEHQLSFIKHFLCAWHMLNPAFILYRGALRNEPIRVITTQLLEPFHVILFLQHGSHLWQLHLQPRTRISHSPQEVPHWEGELRDIITVLKGDHVMFSLRELRFNIPDNLLHWPLQISSFSWLLFICYAFVYCFASALKSNYLDIVLYVFSVSVILWIWCIRATQKLRGEKL